MRFDNKTIIFPLRIQFRSFARNPDPADPIIIIIIIIPTLCIATNKRKQNRVSAQLALTLTA